MSKAGEAPVPGARGQPVKLYRVKPRLAQSKSWRTHSSPQERDNRLCPTCKRTVLFLLQALVGASSHGERSDEMGTSVQTEAFEGTEGSPKLRKGHGDGAIIRVGFDT